MLLRVQLPAEVGDLALLAVHPLRNEKVLATKKSLGMNPQLTSHPALGATTSTTSQIIRDAHLAAGLGQTFEPLEQSTQLPKGSFVPATLATNDVGVAGMEGQTVAASTACPAYLPQRGATSGAGTLPAPPEDGATWSSPRGPITAKLQQGPEKEPAVTSTAGNQPRAKVKNTARYRADGQQLHKALTSDKLGDLLKNPLGLPRGSN